MQSCFKKILWIEQIFSESVNLILLYDDKHI